MGIKVAPLSVEDAVTRFLKSHGCLDEERKYSGDLEHGTWRKYRNSLALFASFCNTHRVAVLMDITLDTLEDFRATRRIAPVTWKVELQALRTFFNYCVSHKWLTTNPAKLMKGPRNLKPNEVVPYTLQEESQILAACEMIGGGGHSGTGVTYARRRARAIVLVLRHTALRLVDVCTLRRDAISWGESKSTWRVLLRTQKSGQPVYLPIPERVKLALDAVSSPRNAGRDCPYYFWNGLTSRRAVVGIAERALAAVFRRSGVKHAHAHRYRHTLATRLLEGGASLEEIADILGNSPAIVRKHYAKWSQGRQNNIDKRMLAHFGTEQAPNAVTIWSHENTAAVTHRAAVTYPGAERGTCSPAHH